MGSIGGLAQKAADPLGLAGQAQKLWNGSTFSAASANLTDPVTGAQLNQADTGVQNSMQSQQQLLTALQGQNGIGNQSQVYNQLQGIAGGTGPNPALAQLNQTTGQNVANQAALMAGQRGASSNVGLMARQAGQTGGNLQQQAVGQGATLQAQQQLNAINAAGGIAGQQVNNQVGQTNANTNAQEQYQQNLLNATGAYNNAQVGNQTNLNNVNAGVQAANYANKMAIVGGIAKGAGSAAAMASGGMVHQYADGGATSQAPVQSSGPQSKFGKALKGMGDNMQPLTPPGENVSATGSAALNSGIADLTSSLGKRIKTNMKAPSGAEDVAGPSMPMSQGSTMAGGPADLGGMSSSLPMAAKGGMVPALLSPGEQYLEPKEAEQVAKGKASPAQVGKIVPGKPKHKGNNYDNDVVPAKLEEGGIVIPNSIMQSKDPVRGAADFVNKIMAKRRVK